MLIFSAENGRISRFVSRSETTDATITFPGFNYARMQVIIQRNSLKFQPSYQATSTLGNDIHLISFGEALTPISLTGVIIDGACDSLPAAVNFGDDVNGFGFNNSGGIQGVVEWWQRENLTRRETPVQLVLGDSYSLRGYIADFSCSVSAVDKVWNFQMNILKVPPRREINDARQAAAPRPVQPAPAEPEMGGPVLPFHRVQNLPISENTPQTSVLTPLPWGDGTTVPLTGEVTGK